MYDTKRNVIWAFACLCCLNLIASLDVTALSVCIPTIAMELNATSIQAYWAGTSFILASAICQPLISALSRTFGRNAMIQLSLVIFAVGTIMCGTCHRVATLLAGRTLQGIGSGGMVTMTYVVMVDLLDLRARATGLSVLAIIWAVGSCTGPVMGGAFTTYVTWRWIFWTCLPLVGIGFALTTFSLHTGYKPEEGASKSLNEVDWGGAAIFVASLTSFLVAISWGGTQFAWDSFVTLVPLVLGAAGISWWLLYEHHVPSSPMIPLSVLNTRTALLGFIATLLMGIVYFSLLYFLPLYYEASKGYSPLISGVALLPNCIGSAIAAGTLSQYISKTGHYNYVTWAGWVLLALASGVLVLLNSETSVPAWIFLNVIGGLGIGCLFASLSMATQAPQTEKNMPIAAGLTPFFRAIGQACGIAISDAIYQNRLKTYLLNGSSHDIRIKADELAKNSASIVAILRLLPHGSSDLEELLNAFNKSLHAIWWTMLGISVFGGVLSLFMKELSLDSPRESASGVTSSDPERGVKLEEYAIGGVTAGEANSSHARTL